jgi:hypothetical protein
VSLQRIGVVTFTGFHVMSFAALSVFEVANSEFGERRYDVSFYFGDRRAGTDIGRAYG